MARHSKWHNIKARKGVQDKLRGKTFTIHAKLITLAAQRGGDPDKNPTLAEAIFNAKKANVPADNIDRAIKKGTGEDKNAAVIMEMYYEWYAPGGVGVIARTLTDNKNRTASNMRHAFSKFGGNLAETGAVSSYGFEYRGVCTLSAEWIDLAKLEEAIIESGAADYRIEDDEVTIYTERADLAAVTKSLIGAGYSDIESELAYVPSTMLEIDDFDKLLKILKLLEAIEEDEDVDTVWTNYHASDELLERAYTALEDLPFRT